MIRSRIVGGQRSSVVHYGVLAILLLLLFIIGARLGVILIENVRQPLPPAHAAARVSGGTAFVQPPRLVQDFTLTSQTGQPLSLSDLRGQPVLLFFGYTHCPDVCPLTLADYTRVKGELGVLANDVHFVFVSVDGERDTPPVVADYLRHFDERFIGMTGDPASLRELGVQFGLVFEAVVLGKDGSQRPASESNENYFVHHTSPSFLIDRHGYLNRVFFYGTRPAVIASNLRQFLSED